MTHRRTDFLILFILGAAGYANGQILGGDEHFPIIKELRWESTMEEARTVCERSRVSPDINDSVVVVTIPLLGFTARTEFQFNQSRQSLKSVQAKFNEANAALVDSVTGFFTRTLGRPPVRTAKEKSLILFTVRLEMAVWRAAWGMVNLVTAKQGNSFLEASLVFFPPTIQQSPAANQ